MVQDTLPDSSYDDAALPAGDLTPGEQLIWAGQLLDPDSPLYNMALAVEVGGAVDVGAVRRALEILVEEDAVLRTVFHERGGRPERCVLPKLEPELEVLELPVSLMDEEAFAVWLEERTRRRLPLDEPLFDACLVRRGPDRYVLYFNQHHILTDAWASGVLYRRWGELYRRLVAGEEHPRSDVPAFAYHADRVRELRSSAKLADAIAYWESTSPGAEADVSVYGNREAGSGRTLRVRVPMGVDRTVKLRRLAGQPPFRALTSEQSHYLVFATVLLAWLHRVSDRPDVSIGSPWHNRPTADLRETLGLLIELYPIRAVLDENETFSSLGRKVASATMKMMRHVVPGASAAPGARGFTAVLNYITASLGDFAGIPAKSNWVHSGYGDREHRIRLQVHDFDGAGEPTLDFDLDVHAFDTGARRWAVEDFFDLFDALSENPDQPIASVPLRTWQEEESYVPRGTPHAATASVMPALRRRFVEAAERVALVDEGRHVSYRSLGIRVAAIAEGLRQAGLRPGGTVGICMGRSTDLVASILGVLDVGAAFVPMDPAHPDERLHAVARDAKPDLVIVDAELLHRLSGRRLRLVSVDHLVGPGASSLADAEHHEPAADDLAYVLYTSGSTGFPKGVEVTHGALADYAEWACGAYMESGGLRMPLFTSPAFDFTLTSIFAPLLSGGAVVVYREDVENSSLLVRRVFEADDVDVAKLTPSHLAIIRDLDLSASRVRRLIVGGENLQTSVARRIHDAFGGSVEIFNEYGPTEATVGCMIHRYDPEADTRLSVPIGRPAGNMRVHVLDSFGQPVPRGATGEICVRGPRLARGYRNRPDLTEASFVTVPESGDERMYRTGDLGRWSSAGYLDFLGRSDDQVKIRGVRIELGEVEAALTKHRGVNEVVAHVLTDRRPTDAHCRICGLEAGHPEAHLNEDQVCSVCRMFEDQRNRVERYFGTMEELEGILAWARREADGPHDTLMLYSGGKDSTYALCRIVEMGANPLVFMMDNGYISEDAKSNIQRVVHQLGLELVVGQTPAMATIFADSLARFSDVCQGCFKTIYTLAMNEAVDRGIPAIFSGLSRGQIFETRLTDLYRRGMDDPDDIDRMVLEARKAYHRMDDATAQCLDTRIFETDEVLDRIRFVDFYRYCDVPLDELLDYVKRHTPWIRPSDTGRSTNCLINEAGIFVHKTERGFHNYAMPYSWDVRLGHKERNAALAELDDDLDPVSIRRMLDEIGYRERPAPPPEARLMAYYTADVDLSVSELRSFLAQALPGEAIPSGFVRVNEMPLTANGKIDRGALPQPPDQRPLLDGSFVAPSTPIEAQLVELWQDILGLKGLSVEDDFFELGGDSMHCIQIVSEARQRGLVFTPRDLFAHATVAELSRIVEVDGAVGAPSPATANASELLELEEEFGD